MPGKRMKTAMVSVVQDTTAEYQAPQTRKTAKRDVRVLALGTPLPIDKSVLEREKKNGSMFAILLLTDTQPFISVYVVLPHEGDILGVFA